MTETITSDRLAMALHEASVYGIGATSDANQKVILMAAQESERLLAALKEIADYWGSSNDDAEPCREIARKALGL